MNLINHSFRRNTPFETADSRFSLSALVNQSVEAGWSSTNVSENLFPKLATSIRAQAEIARYKLVANRSGQDPLDTLRPRRSSVAHPNSLSARYGLGQQPLHTDGAHQLEPPDLVLLWAKEPNNVPTRIWKPRDINSSELRGMFSITDGKRAWVGQVRDSRGNYRFDPGCMNPLDHFAKLLCERFLNPPEDEVHEFQWDSPNTVLLIRNGVVLHGRSKVSGSDGERVLNRVALRRIE